MQFVPQFVPCPTVPCPTTIDLEDWLAGFIERMPIEDLGDEFQRGFLGGLMSVYEAAGFDLKDARYLAGERLAKRMDEAA